MAGYLVTNLDVHDGALFAEYSQQVAPIVAAHGGRYLIRGGEPEQIEGNLPVKRIVVLEFPTLDAVRRFYDSPEYEQVKKLRADSAKADMAFFEGHVG